MPAPDIDGDSGDLAGPSETGRFDADVRLIITSDPDIMGGAWCISGTRIPAKAVQSFHEHGYDPCDRGYARNTPVYAMTRFTPRLSSRSQSQ